MGYVMGGKQKMTKGEYQKQHWPVCLLKEESR